MKKLEKEIQNGNELKINIPVFSVRMMEIYRRYAAARLSMNYFTFYEVFGEAKSGDEKLQHTAERFNQIVKNLDSSDSGVILTAVTEIETLRNHVIDVMKGFSAWADIFKIYEYCLNRVEYRFKDGSDVPESSTEEMTRDILQYIIKDKDPAVMNSKICDTVCQLPVRMTKSHFFELLREGLKVYKDSEKRSVDDFVYMIRTVSMLEIPDMTFQLSEEMNDIYGTFRDVDFNALEETSYQALRDKLTYAAEYIEDETDLYMMLAENINDAYVMLLTSPAYYEHQFSCLSGFHEEQEKISGSVKDYENCRILIEKENQLFFGADYDALYDEIEDGFLYLEGKQEKYSGLFRKYAYLFETIADDDSDVLKELGAELLPDVFDKIEKLVSGSLFVEFTEGGEGDSFEPADVSYVKQKADALEAELTQFFQTHGRMVNRAVMAHILSELPVFFHNMDEIKDYVYNSLDGCRDAAEKTAVYEIFQQMIAEDE